MATFGNWYSFSHSHFPQTMTNTAGTVQYGFVARADFNVTAYKRILPTVGHPADDRYTTFPLETIPGNPLALPLNPADSHYHLALAVDNHECVHIAGNCHNPSSSPLRYVKSNAADITTWTAGVYNTIGGGFALLSDANAWEYQLFNRMSNGDVVWFFNRQPTTSITIGRDYFGMRFPASATNLTQYVPILGSGNGQIASCNDNAIAGSDAQWVYVAGVEVTDGAGGPGTDRLHIWGAWRTYANAAGGLPSETGHPGIPDPPSQMQPFYLWTETLGTPTWFTASGSPVAMPLTWATRAPATVDSAPDYSRSGGLGFAVDKNLHPHLSLRIEDTANWVHCWWDGGSWQSEPLFSPGDPALGAYLRRVGTGRTGSDEIWQLTKAVGGRVRVRSMATHASLNLGDVIDPDAIAVPNPDPILLRKGIMDVMIPDGETPKNYQFGNHHRCIAS